MGRSARTNAHPDLFAGLELESNAKPAIRFESPITSEPEIVIERDAQPTSVWVAVYLPSLALQALQDDCRTDDSCVIIDDKQSATVIATNKAARRKGIFPGHVLRSALALDERLQILERQPAREHALLERVATRLLNFTSRVSLQSPQCVLLEVRGSLRLFSGIDNLCDRLSAQMTTQGLFFRYSVAPTATAAHWLAKVGYSPSAMSVVEDGLHCADFLRALNALDISVTEWPSHLLESLSQMGVQTLADCRRLPRAGLVRRFGPSMLQTMAQAFGELPEVRGYIREPKTFDALYQLDAEISEATQLAVGCEYLLRQLADFLRRHQVAVRQLMFRFHAWRGEAGALSLTLSNPGYQLSHWQRLLATHLECCELTQPAVAISLVADVSEQLNPTSETLALIHNEQELQSVDTHAAYELLDRLRARLGEKGVYALQHVNTHCPATASRLTHSIVTPSTPSATQTPQAALPADWWLHERESDASGQSLLRQRPLWLLQLPQQIRCEHEQLFYQGRLALRHGPERIESAWWEQSAEVRDYFIADTESGARLWVFRQYAGQQAQVSWWLHGIFG